MNLRRLVWLFAGYLLLVFVLSAFVSIQRVMMIFLFLSPVLYFTFRALLSLKSGSAEDIDYYFRFAVGLFASYATLNVLSVLFGVANYYYYDHIELGALWWLVFIHWLAVYVFSQERQKLSKKIVNGNVQVKNSWSIGSIVVSGVVVAVIVLILFVIGAMILFGGRSM